MRTEQTLRRLYDAFAVLDADTVASCYAPDARFDDEAFSRRGAREVGGMWKMLCSGTQAKGAAVWIFPQRSRIRWSIRRSTRTVSITGAAALSQIQQLAGQPPLSSWQCNFHNSL